jgi:hypothetical protein
MQQMHPLDRAILDNTITEALWLYYTGQPLPEPGATYWADALRETHAVVTAVFFARKRMIAAGHATAAV